MQLKLEEVLKDKERELKLYQKFLDLKSFCEETLFPVVDLPLKQHVEDLKQLIERIIPDPKDRTEELFSGEIFTLLGMIYLHDIGLIKNYEWTLGRNVLTDLDGVDKRMLANYGIGEKLDIPVMAIEIINYLTFSSALRKIPTEWEINEKSRKAIVRNTRLIGGVFNFAHLLLDLFYSDLRFPRLNRFNNRNFILRNVDAQVDVDSREGVITIKYNAKFPYELHVLENVKNCVEDAFELFKNSVNGKQGFNYRAIAWDITSNFSYERDIFEIPKFSPYNETEGPPFERWEKASLIIDRLFDLGYAIVVGDVATGKTTVLRSFIIPQLLSISPNVFYCELWEKPVSEIKDIISKRCRELDDPGLDVVSLVRKLLDEGPCFFIFDNCERYAHLEATEKEKLDRLITFCIEHENIYLIVSGDKETFFEWYRPFNAMSMSAICEIKPIEGTKAIDAYGEEKVLWDTGERYRPIECELLQANLSVEDVLEELLKHVKEEDDLRRIAAVFLDGNRGPLMRHTLESVFFETDIPHKKILRYLNLLKEKDILKEFESMGQIYYALSSRYLKGALHKILRLDDFEEKQRIRNILHNSIINETFLEDEALTILDKWKDELVFSKEETGMILASLISQSEDITSFFEKAKRDGRGIDIQPILKLLYAGDSAKRRKAIELLVEVQDKNMINPLLAHLKREDVFEIKNLLIEGIGHSGKKRAILAIMDTLKEIGDRELKLRAIEFFYSLLDGNLKSILTEIRESEEDPVVATKIDGLLSTIKET